MWSQEAGMAQKVTVALEDDLDGGRADETVRFGIGGVEYEIDLSKKNAAAFRRKVAPFIEHARKTRRGPRRRAGMIPLTVPEAGGYSPTRPRPAASGTGWTGGAATRPARLAPPAHPARPATPRSRWPVSE